MELFVMPWTRNYTRGFGHESRDWLPIRGINREKRIPDIKHNVWRDQEIWAIKGRSIRDGPSDRGCLMDWD